MFIDRAGALGGLLMPPPPARPSSASTTNDAARVDALAAPHPIATMMEKIKLTGAYRA